MALVASNNPLLRRGSLTTRNIRQGVFMQSTQLESPQETAPIKDLVRKSEIRERLGSLDAFRGMIMLLMLNEATRLPLVARSFPQSAIWAFIAYNTEHVDWQGCSLH